MKSDSRIAANQLAEAIGVLNCPRCGEAFAISSEQLDRKLNKGTLFPQLLWEGPDVEGDYIVSLVGLPKYHLSMHGKSVAEALRGFGEVLALAFEGKL